VSLLSGPKYLIGKLNEEHFVDKDEDASGASMCGRLAEERRNAGTRHGRRGAVEAGLGLRRGRVLIIFGNLMPNFPLQVFIMSIKVNT